MLIRPPVVRDLRKDLWAKMTTTPDGAAPQDPRMISIPVGSDHERRLASLKELGELRDSGVLTEEEFAKEKARILD